jgi:Ca2+-binding RTX toxin-like protein
LPTVRFRAFRPTASASSSRAAPNLDLGLRGDIPILPDLVADFVVDWSFTTGSLSVAPAVVKFENIGVDIASLVDILAEVMDPILGFTKEFPFQDIISGLTEPVPEPFASIINFLDVDRIPLDDGDGKINFLDFAAIYYEQQGNQPAVEAISIFAEALGIIQMLTGGANGDLAGVVKLGDLDFTTGAANFSANADALADADGLLAIAQQFQEAMEAIEGLIESVQTSLAGGFTDTVGLAFPILDNPGSIVSLFLPDLFPSAEPIVFVEYDLPALQVDVKVGDFFFSILGPIGINLGGSFGAGIDFKISYDSTGLTDPGPDGFTIDDLLKGLVLSPSGADTRVAYIDSTIHAGAGIELVAARAFVEGGLNGNVAAYFPSNELRFEDVAAGCIFDPITGAVGAELRLRLEVGFGLFSWTVRKTLAETTLVDFSFGCDGDGTIATDPGKGLASLKAGDASTLVLHAGALAGQRSINGTPGVDGPDGETFLVGNTTDENGNLIAGTLTVSAFGINEMYGSPGAPILKIGGANALGSTHGASFGQGNDSLVIAASVAATADVFMGAGHDYATGGAGDDVLRGEDGFDELVGHGGGDQLYGGASDDTLEGGAGADLLDGGEGRDQVSYESSAVAVVFNKAPDATGALVGEGGDAEGDRLVSIEYIVGSAFNDILVGNPGAGNTLEGRSGSDVLIGGTADDFLLGGIDGDVMNGGAGRGRHQLPLVVRRGLHRPLLQRRHRRRCDRRPAHRDGRSPGVDVR